MTLSLSPPRAAVPVPAVGLAVGAMIAIQLGTALSRPFVEEIGAPAFTWLRMCAAALLLAALVRPRVRGRSARDIAAAVLLGSVLGLMSTATFAAAARLPLGLVATIAYLGPLAVAVAGARSLRGVGLALLAALGVAASVGTIGGGAAQAWTADPEGLALAGLGAAAWAAYILLTRKVGQAFSGMEGLCLSLATSALVLAPFGISGLGALPAPHVLAGAAAVAVLAPLLTCGAEMAALRRLGPQSFGVLMSLEPAIAALLGLALLSQVPSGWQILGTACVVLASAATVSLPARGPSKE